MAEPLRILVVEDSELDAELMLRELQRGGLECHSRRVDSEPGLRREMRDFRPGVVLSDFSMPGFDGRAALAIVRESPADVPFIFVSGIIGEEAAVEAMKAGAHDYVMKSSLARLVPAVRRELREADVRRARKAAEGALQDSEAKYREFIEQARDGIFLTDDKGNFLLANSRYCEMLGYTEAELLRSNVIITRVEEDKEQFAQRVATLHKAKGWLLERTMQRKDGTRFPVEVSVRLLANGTVQGIARDITERKRAADELRERDRRFSSMLANVELISMMLDREARITYCNDYLLRLTGWQRDEVLGRNWFELFTPRDLEGAKEAFSALLADRPEAWHHENDILTRAGARRLVRWNNSVLRSGSGEVIGTASIGEDITEQRQAEVNIRRLNRVYAVLSGINTVIVRVRDQGELFREACRIAVEAGRFRMAWIGMADRDAREVKPVSWHGDVGDFFASAPFAATGAGIGGEGLAWQAIMGKEARISNDVQNDPHTRMKQACRERDINSLAILPLVVEGTGVGVLALYASEMGFFDDTEMKLLMELASDISFALDHIEKSSRLDYLAFYDPSTGVANRKLFLERIDQRIRIAAEQKSRLAIVMLDIERFKTLNDTLGRRVGDALLEEFVRRFVHGSGNADRVGRIVGDQFALVIPDVPTAEVAARRLEQKLKECLGPPFLIEGSELRIAAKAGIAMYPEDGANAEVLARNAEAALKKAKAAGDRFLFYAPRMSEQVAGQLALENKLRLALEREEFVLHYQPKVAGGSRRIVGVEALIRWQNPGSGLVPPMQFIPLMEETGLILEVGAWALRRAVLDHRRWLDMGIAAPRIAVNVSPIQLRRQDFLPGLAEALKLGRGAPGIDIEITEGTVMEDIGANMKKLEAVRSLGVNIAVDDFGTGYSSLGYLATLPVASLKIERSFVITMGKDPAVMTLVSTIVSLAHSLKLQVVAEGVDAEDQAQVLERLGCDQMQGYLFSKPLPFDAITALLLANA